jgi:hypothetical protein
LRQVTADAFLVLLRKAADTTAPPSPIRSSAIPDSLDTALSLTCVFNCSFRDLTLFGRELEIDDGLIPPEISQLCYRDEDMKSTLQQQPE